MGMMIIRHKVRDYGLWRPIFNDHAEMQKAAGLTNPRVHHSADSNKPSAWRPCFARAESSAEFVAGVAGYYAVAAVLPNFYSLLGHSQCRQHVAWKRPSLPTKGFLFGDFRLTLAFLRGRGCAWIAALINRPTSGLIRHGNRIAFSFGTWGAYGCAASAGCIVVGRMRDAESQSKKKSASN